MASSGEERRVLMGEGWQCADVRGTVVLCWRGTVTDGARPPVVFQGMGRGVMGHDTSPESGSVTDLGVFFETLGKVWQGRGSNLAIIQQLMTAYSLS